MCRSQLYVYRVLSVAPLCSNFQRLVDDPIDGLHLKLQLAVVCDVGRVINKATYALESDTPMVEKVNGFKGSVPPPICT